MTLPGVDDGPHECGELVPILSNYGDEIGAQCPTCLKIRPRCRVCRVVFKDLRKHLSQSYCGYWDKKGMWWTPVRRPGAAYSE